MSRQVLWLLLAAGCGADAQVPRTAALTLSPTPGSFPARLEPDHNPTTLDGVILGCRLFYDPQLSVDGRVACATCHEPERAFSDGDTLSSRGVSGKTLGRHTPSLFNVAWASHGLFWDGGAKNLESLSLGPLTSADEMGREGTLEALIAQLNADPAYPPLFARAFATNEITLSLVLRALAQFQRNLVAAGARWDRRELVPLTVEEQRGEQLFATHCARCHVPGLFTDNDFHNNGLDALSQGNADEPSQGRARITLDPNDRGKLKTPTLRELARSAPYMHDGRFATLEEVIEHYRNGMVATPTLDPGFLRTGAPPGITISDSEAQTLLAFLKTLNETDPSRALQTRGCAP